VKSFKDFMEAFGVSGTVTFLLAFFTLFGLVLTAFHNPEGSEIWKEFATAFTTFISGKAIHSLETSTSVVDKIKNKNETELTKVSAE
jgi:ABC-type uncharacterized transport system permease subunit